MFLRLPFLLVTDVHKTVLAINTVLLIAGLVVIELVYTDTPKAKRQHLKYFAPLAASLVVLLVYAIYQQVGKS